MGYDRNISNIEECEAACVDELTNKTALALYYEEYKGSSMEGKGVCYFNDWCSPPTCDFHFASSCLWVNGNQESSPCDPQLFPCIPANAANCTINFKLNGELIILIESFALHSMRESLIP